MTSKRKSQPVVMESPAKRPSNQGGDNSSGEEEGEEGDQPWERRAGMILEVMMRNFMCHQVCNLTSPGLKSWLMIFTLH